MQRAGRFLRLRWTISCTSWTKRDSNNYWRCWLKRYWQNRLEGVPKPLESDEIKGMLKWLPHLTGVFSEAVDLAIQMPKIQWNAGEMLYRLEKGDLPNTHPEADGAIDDLLGTVRFAQI